MLWIDPVVLDDIKKREEERRREQNVGDYLYLPIPEYEEPVDRQKNEDDSDGGCVIVIEM